MSRFSLVLFFILLSACSKPVKPVQVSEKEFLSAIQENKVLVKTEEGDKVTIQAALEAGVDPNLRSARGASALEIAASNGNLIVVQFLLEAGADPTQDESLIDAAFFGRLDIVKLLLEAGADPNQEDSDYEGNTAILTAVEYSYLEIAELLKEKGAVLDARHEAGGAALRSASCSGRFESVKLLLEAGADPNARDGQETPLYLARSVVCRDPVAGRIPGKRWYRYHDEIAELLKASGAK